MSTAERLAEAWGVKLTVVSKKDEPLPLPPPKSARQKRREEWDARRRNYNQEEFWFIWNPEATRPSMRYPSEQAAGDLARHLASKYPGQEFLIYRATIAGRVSEAKEEQG